MPGGDARGAGDPPAPLTLEGAARRLGLHYMTVYRHVRTGRLPATRRSGRWWIEPADLEGLEAPAPPGRGTRPTRWAARRRRLVERLLAADAGGAWEIVEQAMAQGATPADVYVQLLGPALGEIGAQWAAGTTTVEGEHRATAAALRVVGRLGARFVRRGTAAAGTVVLGAAPGDPHLLPVVMVADLLRSHHIHVLDLGANVPQVSFLEAADAIPDLRAVGVSLSDGGRSRAAARVLRALRRAHPGVTLLAGGPALTTEDAALALGADGWAADGLATARLLGGRDG
ncbi:MAG: cobalamin-dependent protein [Acidimicrobiales bacterium]